MLRNPHVGQRVVVRYAKNKGQLPLHGACGTARNGPHAALTVLLLIVLAVLASVVSGSCGTLAAVGRLLGRALRLLLLADACFLLVLFVAPVVLVVVLVHVLAHLLLFCCHHGHRRIRVVPTHFEEPTDGPT